MKIGYIRKLKSEHKSVVEYNLPLSEDTLQLNSLLGKPLKINHTGNKQCLATGKDVKKTYGQGYSWESYITLPECDQCIVHISHLQILQKACFHSKHCFV